MGLVLMQTLRIRMGLVLMYLQLILRLYANEWYSFKCKHFWDPKCVHSPLKLATY